MMEKVQRKGYVAVTTLGTSALFAIPPVSFIFASMIKILPQNFLFNFLLPLLTSVFIGLLSYELLDAIKTVFFCWIFFFIELLLVLNLPVFVGTITPYDVILWRTASVTLTIRFSLFAWPSILLGGIFGSVMKEYYAIR